MKKIPLFFIFCILPVYAFSLSGETEKPAVSELTKESENTSTETDLSETDISAPVQIEIPDTEPDEFFFPEISEESEETPESLRRKLEENKKNYIMYKTFQFTSVGITALGLLMVILDAFIETGSEYPYTPIPTDSNPNPSAVTTAFGNLSIAGAVVTVLGAGACVGFQFPYRKYRNHRYLLENRLQNLERLNETGNDPEEPVKEIVTD